MKSKPFGAALIVASVMLAIPGASAFARDDGPRLAQDRLDALVAQHRDAARHVGQTPVRQDRERSQDPLQAPTQDWALSAPEA
ncbi:hypothetical protein QCE63_08740 [Caballeronia sp. LZ065]|uniref:hypothetical protein n=1 Tax=Caballeronia sp. LZ065 TaxID=3038571 RepID=UPI0028589AD5|nr:hypothetical protein [Caballeronia sp. LZ065]MDR5779513.1 hypothetical protein [Caballeronia sp. LZ065]